ncbi:ubiquitin-like-specific protease ESD4 [Populus nigra]|uniref:ubiquitin-like-specific protease ESD4 n=1 Tax=Populus nigra TaxID=3691 RepID=UPI002B275357|nr:ubiquitin-like-specific protease ESD4 [Populus nigra]
MGALTSSGNHKRDHPCNYNPYSNSPDFHISKKPRFSTMHQTRKFNNQTLGSSNSIASRISKYPETATKFRREVHAPCSFQKFTLSRVKSGGFSDKERNLGREGDVMGNFLSRKLDYAKQSAFGAIRYLVKEKEVIDVDDESEKIEKEIVSEDSSIEEVEVFEEDGREGGSAVLDWMLRNGVVGSENDGDVKILEERSVVTIDGNLGVENTGKMLGSLALNNEFGVLTVETYKKLLEDTERRNGRLGSLKFEIEYNEKRWDSFKALRPVKKEPVEEIPREPFIPLTPEEETEVKQAFFPNNRRRVLVSHGNSNIDITGQILHCLAPGAWLNDEVINLYMELLKERERREPKKFLKCHFFNTFFYKKLTGGGKGGYDYRAVKRWTTEKKLGYFLIDCDKIFVPVHQEIHWCLAVINKKDQKFQYLDSLKGRDNRVLESLAKYYAEEVKDKSKKDIDVSNWEREFVEDLPEQQNGYDCGVFMIKYADFYSRGIGLCFGQEHMPYFRLRTAKEILRLRAD